MHQVQIRGDEVMLTGFADDEQARFREDFQMMRDGGLREREELADLAAGQLAGGGDFLQHPEPLGIRERFQHAQQPDFVHIEILLNTSTRRPLVINIGRVLNLMGYISRL
jgi:hypothetical protein